MDSFSIVGACAIEVIGSARNNPMQRLKILLVIFKYVFILIPGFLLLLCLLSQKKNHVYYVKEICFFKKRRITLAGTNVILPLLDVFQKPIKAIFQQLDV